jgi:hypothetical protein
LALRLLVELLLLPSIGALDLFPFSSFALFSSIDKEAHFIHIYVRALDDKVFDPPESIYTVVRKGHPRFLTFFDYLHLSIRNPNVEPSVMKAHADIALSYLFGNPSSLVYEIRVSEIDKLEFLKKGVIKNETFIRSFAR